MNSYSFLLFDRPSSPNMLMKQRYHEGGRNLKMTIRLHLLLWNTQLSHLHRISSDIRGPEPELRLLGSKEETLLDVSIQ